MKNNPKQKNKRREWSFNLLAFKVFSQRICFYIYIVCYNMNEDNALEKL